MRHLRPRARVTVFAAAIGCLMWTVAACGGAAPAEPESAANASPTTPAQSSSTPAETSSASQDNRPPALAPPTPESDGESRDAEEATANINSSLDAIDTYAEHNDTYAGISVAALQASYDAGLPLNISFGQLSATTYCIQSTVGDVTVRKNGPEAEIETGACFDPNPPDPNAPPPIEAADPDWAHSATLICEQATRDWNNAYVELMDRVVARIAALDEPDPSSAARSEALIELAEYQRATYLTWFSLYERRQQALAALGPSSAGATSVEELLDELAREALILQEFAERYREATPEAVTSRELEDELDTAHAVVDRQRIQSLARGLGAEACDDLDREHSNDPVALSPRPAADWSAAANRLCRQANAQLRKAFNKLPEPADESDAQREAFLAALFDAATAFGETRLARLDALPVPPAHRDRIEAFLKATQVEIQAARIHDVALSLRESIGRIAYAATNEHRERTSIVSANLALGLDAPACANPVSAF